MSSKNDQYREKLFQLIKQFALIRSPDKPMKMASGQTTDIYFNMKGVTLRGESLTLIAKLFLDKLSEVETKKIQIAGVSVGGDPLVAGLLIEATEQKKDFILNGLLVRKEPKSHGASEGQAVDGEKAQGQGVWLLEDVVSTGGSSLKALGFLKAENYKVLGLYSILDREMGGFETLQKEYPNLKTLTLFKLSDFV